MNNVAKAFLVLFIFVLVAVPVTMKVLAEKGVVKALIVEQPGKGGIASAPRGEGSDNRSTAGNRPFVNDPDLIGAWESVDFVKAVDDFQPARKAWKGELPFKGLTFLADGVTSGPFTWTKGYLWHPQDHAESQYTIKTIDGTKYLFMEWVNGDVLIRHEKPSYYVMRPKA